MSEPSIAKVLPEEYAAYEQALTGDGGLNDVRVCLALLAKAREALECSVGEYSQEDINAYCAAWRLCLRTMQNSTDPTARKLILDAWNKSLQEDSDLASLQIYALCEHWDQKLLTDDFWQLLSQTNKKETVFAICYVLYERGNAADIGQLMQNANPALMWDFRKSCRTQMTG